MKPGGSALADLAHLDLAPLRLTTGGVKIVVASDVDNPLLGPAVSREPCGSLGHQACELMPVGQLPWSTLPSAAAVFAPQKGAGPQQVATLERSLRHWSQVVSNATGRDDAERAGAGAAGGTGFAALALLNAEIKPGIELILELIDFDPRIAGADLVVTGEGSLDEQSLAGKAPVGVARAAASAGISVVAVAGRLRLGTQRLREAGISAAYALTDLEPDLDRCIAEASSLLRRVGAEIAKEWLR